MHLQGIADPGGAGAQNAVQIAVQGVGAVQIHPVVAASRQAKAGQQPGQAEDVIAVHVGNEYPPQLGEAEVAAQELMLRSLTAVEQPKLRPLGQPQGDGRNVACPCRDAGTGAEKGDLHGR